MTHAPGRGAPGAPVHGHGQGHAHAHGQGHGHHPAPSSFGRAFALGTVLNLAYVALEAGYGLASGSLALVADAGHNLSDVLGLLLAWGAAWLSGRPPTGRRSYGFKRAPILASLANALILLVAVGAIVWEAADRLLEPRPVETGTVLWVAVAGIGVNAGTAWLFASGREGDLNIRGVFLHMVADTGVTVGVVAAALLIRWTGLAWIDPVVSLGIAAVILLGTWGLLRDGALLALDAVPPGVDEGAVRGDLAALPGVTGIHDLHIWGLSTTETALTAHLVRENPDDDRSLLQAIGALLRERHGTGHPTIQLETPEMARHCPLRPDAVV